LVVVIVCDTQPLLLQIDFTDETVDCEKRYRDVVELIAEIIEQIVEFLTIAQEELDPAAP
jgi:hypothetical protein